MKIPLFLYKCASGGRRVKVVQCLTSFMNVPLGIFLSLYSYWISYNLTLLISIFLNSSFYLISSQSVCELKVLLRSCFSVSQSMDRGPHFGSPPRPFSFWFDTLVTDINISKMKKISSIILAKSLWINLNLITGPKQIIKKLSCAQWTTEFFIINLEWAVALPALRTTASTQMRFNELFY